LGHDWGGIIAWYYAMRQLRPLSRLCVMNLPHPACLERELRRPKQLRRSWYVGFFQLPWLPEKLLGRNGGRGTARLFRDTAVHPERFDAAFEARAAARFAEPGALTAMINYYRAAGRGFRRQRQRGFPAIDVPTLQLWGERDLALCVETTHGTDAYVSNLVQRYLPRASHWVQQDAPDAVNAMLLAWLRGEPVPCQAPDGRLY
ncbi:MAG: alpha/beta hydrolase, partial [Proteobacteria bacterium]|nr:alpha/beta hydrolase [Pseudomonadota bacterium]